MRARHCTSQRNVVTNYPYPYREDVGRSLLKNMAATFLSPEAAIHLASAMDLGGQRSRSMTLAKWIAASGDENDGSHRST